MNDRFKFRFWSGTKMFYDLENVYGCLMQQVAFNEGNRLPIPYDHVGEHGASFMQCTGLKDKGDVYIYESDIVMCDSRKRTIKWANGKFWFVAEVANQHEDISEIFGRYYGKVQVIGNIHQHKHLLK